MSKKIRMKYHESAVTQKPFTYVEIKPTMYKEYIRLMRKCGYKLGKKFTIKKLAYRFIPKTWIGIVYNKVLAGTCAAAFGGDKNCKELAIARIEGMAVLPMYRRRGMAVALCLEIVKIVHSMGYKTIYVYPQSGNRAAVCAYKKAGFKRG